MSFVADFFGDLTGANDAADAARDASQTQANSVDAGIAAEQKQFDALMKLMSPFVKGGANAFGAQQDLLGLGGPNAQRRAIAGIENSPQFASLLDQGEDAILQNASATGGLRGGNIQEALMKFRPSLLTGLIDQQFNRLGGVAGMGQASAAGQASAGMGFGSNVSNLLQQQGAAIAGGQLAEGNRGRQVFGDMLKLGTAAFGAF